MIIQIKSHNFVRLMRALPVQAFPEGMCYMKPQLLTGTLLPIDESFFHLMDSGFCIIPKAGISAISSSSISNIINSSVIS